MSTFFSILLFLIAICLVLATAVQPVQSHLTKNELKRRAVRSHEYKKELQRHEMYPVLEMMLRAVRVLLLVLLVGISITLFGWWWGVVFSVLFVFLYPVVARMPFALAISGTLYRKVEPSLLNFAERSKKIVLSLRLPSVRLHDTPRQIFSREDLAELIDQSPEVIGAKERALLGSALSFFDKKVSEVMTPRTVIDFIKESEFLGPLVLDELHLLGHSRLPVIDGDLNHVVGVLHLRNLLSLNTKQSTTAEKAMEKQVYYIREDDSLEHALAGFIKTRHHLFIVINRNRETVGLLTLEDVIEALIGRRIVDEDDVYEDLRAVAEKEGAKNNTPDNHVDL